MLRYRELDRNLSILILVIHTGDIFHISQGHFVRLVPRETLRVSKSITPAYAHSRMISIRFVRYYSLLS